MALSAGVQRPSLSDPSFCSAPQKDSTIIYQGAAVMLDQSGLARPAAASVLGAYCVGVALPRDFDLDRYDNTVTGHADGFLTVRYKEGAFGFLNDGTNPILSTSQPGIIIYAKDDQTASLSSSNGTRPVLGRLRSLDSTAIGGPVVVEMSKAIGKAAFEEIGGAAVLSNVWTAGIPIALATAGNDTACTNGDVFWCALYVETPMQINGVNFLIGSVGGTDKAIAALYDASGALLANSALAGATVGTAANMQALDFVTPVTVQPGTYYVAMQFNGTTAKFRTHTVPGQKFVTGSVAGTFGTLAAITPGTTYTANKGVIAVTY